MNERARAILFMAGLGGVCALLLTGAEHLLPAQQAADELDRDRSILHALGVSLPPGASARKIAAAFEQHVRTERRGGMTLHHYRSPGPGGPREAVAIPFIGRGHHGRIHGVIAFEADGRTIRRVVFYRHNETPTLGGQIESPRFQRRFEGRIIRPDSPTPLRIVPARRRDNEIDAISGATMTSRAVERMLNRTIRDYLREAKPRDR